MKSRTLPRLSANSENSLRSRDSLSFIPLTKQSYITRKMNTARSSSRINLNFGNQPVFILQR